MKDIRVKDLVKFRGLSEGRKATFFKNLQKEKIAKEKDDDSGGDYWVRSISAINNTFKENDNKFIADKIVDILNDYTPTLDNGTKVKYDRNLQILHNYEDFNFRSITPSEDINILSKVRKNGVIDVKGLSLKVETHHIYTWTLDDKDFVGAILFAAKKDGYNINELGIFAEAINTFLQYNYADKYIVSPSFVKVVDVITNEIIDYQMILDKKILSLMMSSIEDFKSFNKI